MNKMEKPALTVDIVLLSWRRSRIYILLIKRKNDPFKDEWALPGGYLDKDELLTKAAQRELFEETNLSIPSLAPIGIFDEPGRDPRGRCISHAFWGVVQNPKKAEAGSDATDAKWYPIDKLPDLAFDHDRIIEQARAKVKHHAELSKDLLSGVGEISVVHLKALIDTL